MLTERLYQTLSRIHALPLDFKEALEKEMRYASFPKNHMLVQAHSFAYHAYFLEKGFAVSYQYLRERKLVTAFWQPGDFVFVPKSFFEQSSTDEIIQVTIDSEFSYITFPSANNLFEHYPVANALARSVASDFHANSEQKRLDLQTLGTWDRYLKLLKDYPGVEQHASQDLIASYLNIIPQSLSRMKRRRMRSGK